jgi:PAS domain S-box-containing protein
MTTEQTYQELENQPTELNSQIKTFSFSNPNEQTYHSLFENMAEGFARCRMIYENDEAVDFIYLEVNNAFGKLTGLKNVVGKSISEIIPNHRNDNNELFKLYEKVAQTGLPDKIEPYVEPLDTWFSISVYSSNKGEFLVIFDNITDRKKSETELKLSEAQFRGLFIQSHIPTAIVALDKSFIRTNKAFCNFLGYSENEIIGKSIADFTHPNDIELGMNEMRSIKDGEIEFAVLQKRYIRKDGEILWGELCISIVRDDQNNPLYFLPIIHDITEHYRSEKALKENESRLKKLNHTKDKLFSIIAHDLRSPFNCILGLSDLLIENVYELKHEQTKQYVTYINSAAKNTLVLLDNLLNWAKSQTDQLSFTPKKLAITSLIDDLISASASKTLLKNISLRRIKSDEVEVVADENMVMVILRNLISNAIKFSNAGGEITISVNPKNELAEINVCDTGLGMSKDKLTTLFDISSNKTTLGTAKEKGSGLGLILCKEFVEKNHGTIWVESLEHRGSKFTFTLPMN